MLIGGAGALSEMLGIIGVAAPPAFVFVVVKWLFKYVDWLLPPQTDATLRSYILTLKDSCTKSGVTLYSSRFYSKTLGYIDRRYWRAFFIAIPVSVLLNVGCYLALRHHFSYLEPAYREHLFVYYDPMFFVSLVVWDLFSLFVTIRIMRRLATELKTTALIRFLLLDTIVFLCLGVIQFEFGMNLNALVQEGSSMYQQFGLSFFDFFPWQWIVFVTIVLVMSSARYVEFYRAVRVILIGAVCCFAFGFLESYWIHVADFNTIVHSEPRQYLRYIPQANSKGFLLLNVTSLLPSMMHLAILSCLLLLRFLPRRMYEFIGVNLAAFRHDKSSVISRIGLVVATLFALIAYFVV